MTDHPAPRIDRLREQAEQMLNDVGEPGSMPPIDDVRRLFHELQVHQIELELQNEELRAAQLDLEQSRSHFQRLFQYAPVGYVVLDHAGMIHEVNHTFARMLDKDRVRLQGRPFAECLHPEDRPIFLSRIKALKRPADGRRLELRLAGDHPLPFHVSLRIADAVQDGPLLPGHDEHIFLAVTDISPRVRAEVALRESERFARATVDALAANIAIVDGKGTIIAVNQSWKDFALANNCDPALVSEGVNYLHVCRTAQGTDVEEAWRFADGIEAVSSGSIPTYMQEYPCHAPFANRWFSGRITRFPGEGERRVVIAHIDITERRRLEGRNLQLQSQLNQLEKEDSLGRMASAIAHHFNNLLFIIQGNIELALEDAPAKPLLQQSLRQAAQGTHRAAEICGRMLTYLGLNVKDKSTIDLSATCREGLPLLLAMRPQQIIIRTDFPAQGPMIQANPVQIQELLALVVENAWEACEEKNGEVLLAIRAVDAADIETLHRFPVAWEPQHTEYACLSVIDDGPGITDEQLPRIFDPFFSTKFMGRGMGLPTVLGILRSHEGCVTVISRADRGTTLKAYFPCRADKPARLPKQTPLP